VSSSSEIKCPKCGFTQFTAIQESISSQDKIIFECVECGHKYSSSEKQSSRYSSRSQSGISGAPDGQILELCVTKGKLSAIKFCTESTGWSLKESKTYVDNLAKENGVTSKKGSCFIATACYGDYDSDEVVALRLYRDNVLLKTRYGKLFVKFYYWTSPPIAGFIEKSDRTKTFIRKYILKPLVSRLK